MKRIENNKRKIVELLNKNIDLEYRLFLKRCHRFSEEERNFGTAKEPIMKTVKFGCWWEWFKDEDKPDERGVRIERKQPIEVNGIKTHGFQPISYFTINDI
jgi:hypothetical protein